MANWDYSSHTLAALPARKPSVTVLAHQTTTSLPTPTNPTPPLSTPNTLERGREFELVAISGERRIEMTNHIPLITQLSKTLISINDLPSTNIHPQSAPLHSTHHLPLTIQHITGRTHPQHHNITCQDVVLPYMTDPRHASDTLFFVLEEDWRLTRVDDFSRTELLEQQVQRGARMLARSLAEHPPQTGAAVHVQPPSPEASHTAALRRDWQSITESDHQAHEHGRQGRYAQMRQVQAWPQRTTKPKAEEFKGTTRFLKQLVRLVTAAHREERGDWVWLSWNGSDKRIANPRPEHACTFFAVSRDGAMKLTQEYWEQVWRTHFDVSMKWLFENFTKELRASFVYPTIGHYSTHASDILGEDRTAEWERWYVGEGQVPVQLWTWEKAGRRVSTRQIKVFNFPEEQPEFDWLTLYRESSTPQVEPVATCKAAPNSSNKISGDLRKWQNRSQPEMQHAFNVEKMVGSEQPKTERQQRQRRRYVRDSAYRIFTAKLLEAR